LLTLPLAPLPCIDPLPCFCLPLPLTTINAGQRCKGN
jgi:hypothetical protein